MEDCKLEQIKNLKDIDTKQKEEVIIDDFNLINYRKGTLNFILAKAGHGKTLQLLNILISLNKIKTSENKQKYKTLFISLEMNIEDLAIRIKKIDPEWYETVLKDDIESYFINCNQNPTTINDIRNILFEKKLNNITYDFIFIDYCQLFDGKQEDISKELTKLARNENLIIISALQLSSTFDDKDCSTALSSIAGSTKYSRDATSIVLLVKSTTNTILWYITKNRNGMTLDKAIEAELTENGKIIGTANLYQDTKLQEKTILYYQIGQIITLEAINNINNTNIIWSIKDINIKIDIDFDASLLKTERTELLILLSGQITTLFSTKEALKEHKNRAEKRINDILNSEYEMYSGISTKDILEKKQRIELIEWKQKNIKKWRQHINVFIDRNLKLINKIYEQIGTKITKDFQKLSISDYEEIKLLWSPSDIYMTKDLKETADNGTTKYIK